MKKAFLLTLSMFSIIIARSATVEQSIKKNIKRIQEWQKKGVIFVRPECVLVDANAIIGPGTTIGCSVHVLNNTEIGANCMIEPFCIIDNCTIEDNATIYSHTVLQNSTVKSNAKVGPFARIRKGSIVKSEAEVGNFVEMSDSTIGEKSKAKHLTYLGCTEIQEEVNIGAGTITCNYDGFGKYKTLFKRKSFIGSNSTFVAPVIVGEGAIAAAGSTFTLDIPDNTLGIGRACQKNKEGYAPNLKAKFRNRAIKKQQN